MSEPAEASAPYASWIGEEKPFGNFPYNRLQVEYLDNTSGLDDAPKLIPAPLTAMSARAMPVDNAYQGHRGLYDDPRTHLIDDTPLPSTILPGIPPNFRTKPNETPIMSEPAEASAPYASWIGEEELSGNSQYNRPQLEYSDTAASSTAEVPSFPEARRSTHAPSNPTISSKSSSSCDESSKLTSTEPETKGGEKAKTEDYEVCSKKRKSGKETRMDILAKALELDGKRAVIEKEIASAERTIAQAVSKLSSLKAHLKTHRKEEAKNLYSIATDFSDELRAAGYTKASKEIGEKIYVTPKRKREH